MRLQASRSKSNSEGLELLGYFSKVGFVRHLDVDQDSPRVQEGSALVLIHVKRSSNRFVCDGKNMVTQRLVKYCLLIVWLHLLWAGSFMSPAKVLGFGLTKLEQQINFMTEEFMTTSGTDSPTDNSLGIINFDPDEYSDETVYFEAVIRCDSCTGGNTQVAVSLYSVGGGSQTTVTTTSSTYTRIRSGSLSLSAGDYTVRFQRDATAGTAYIKAARLVVVQSGSGITDTQTHIEVGDYDSEALLSAQGLSAPRYYLYDHDQYSGTVNAYFEATLRTNDNTVADSHHFNARDTGEIWTNPDNMADNSSATFASTSTDGQVQLLTGNNSGADQGEIQTVEVRAYSYQTDGSDGQVILRPVFGGGSDGDNHAYSPPENVGNVAWSSYVDITTDTNAPSNWSWSDVNNLDMDVEFNQGASGTNTAFVAIVQVRVTYEDSDVIAYAELYNRTNSTVVATISTSSNTFERVRSSALSTNWDTSNDDEYEVRIYTSNTDNAADIANAKIVIDQNDANTIDRIELVHQQINSAVTETNDVNTQQGYLNQFSPGSYSGGFNYFQVFFEATMRTSGGTAYAGLYNRTGSDIIDTATSSEISTTSTSFVRQRSSNLHDNADWPTVNSNMDTIMRATTSQTAFVNSSWIVLQVRAVPAEATFRILGVAASETNNGVTTSVATNPTSVPFGNISVNAPVYAAHELVVTTNEASVGGFSVQVRLFNPLQGIYPANHIDGFVGNSASWASPQTWISPTGTTANDETGWFGANITDADVANWSGDTSGKFGPVDSDFVEIMRGDSAEASETEYVSYGIEVNVYQPADYYAGTLQYQFLPVY